MEYELISKGEKGTNFDTDLRGSFTKREVNLNKGFLTLMLSLNQARELKKWLDKKEGVKS